MCYGLPKTDDEEDYNMSNLQSYLEQWVDFKVIDKWVSVNIAGIKLSQMLMALLIFSIFILFRNVLSKIVIKQLHRLLSKIQHDTANNFLAALERPMVFGVLLLGTFAALQPLGLPASTKKLALSILDSLFSLTLFWTAFRIVDPLGYFLFKEKGGKKRKAAFDFYSIFVSVTRFLIFFMTIIVILDKWGFNVVGFVASLGVAGAAIAFAAKDSVANIFGSAVIYMDQTFEKGDRIETPDVHGMVEAMGLRSTRIRTLYRALVTVPNNRLANQPITNWTRMTHRRIKTNIGLEYKTTKAQMEKILTRIRNLLNKDPDVDTNMTTVVNFSGFGESSLDIFLSFFTRKINFNEFSEVQERIFLEIKGIVEEEGTSFAFPSRSLYVEKGDGDFKKTV